MPTEKAISQWLDLAIDLHQRNRTAEARTLYTKVLTFRPEDPDANHYLGLIDEQEGHPGLALERLTKARHLDPENAELLSNLAGLYLGLDRPDDAVTACLAGLVINPKIPTLHNNLGVAYQQTDRHDLAVASFRKALDLSPDYAEAYNNMGSSWVLLDRPERAISSFLEAIKRAPRYRKALDNLDATLKAFALRPPSDGRAATADLVADAYYRLGQIHRDRNDQVSALEAFDKALAHAPDNFDIAVRRLDCLNRLSRTEEVVAALEVLIASRPDNAELHAVLGQAYGQMGETEASVAALRRAVKLDPDYSEAYQMLARALSFAEDKDLVAEMVEAHDRAAPDSTERMRMAFALAKAKEDETDYQQAFAYLLEANRIRRIRLKFDPADARRRLDRLREVFTPALMREAVAAKTGGNAPIFIVGMPRSGTTLVESILAAHPAVQPGGELEIMNKVAVRRGLRDLGQPPLFKWIGANAPFEGLAQAYLDRVGQIVPAAATSERFTDKMPDNFWNIGLIRLAFPDATIIHCRRSPADTCLSLFKTEFDNTAHRYASDLSDLGTYYNLYRAAMRHWEEVLPPGSITTVDYEELVADPEAGIRRLIADCGLDWDDRCLAFHATSHVVHTASLFQVRRPIYTSSTGLAERYGAHLRPLLDALEKPEIA